MSYVSQGAIGLIIGLVLFLFILGLLLIIVSVIMLAYGLGNLTPGGAPNRCATWGHDWRSQLPGMPAGTTCRNCLARKDSALILFNAPPMGIQVVADPRFGGLIPMGLIKHMMKKPPRELILYNQPGMPRVPIQAGMPMPWAVPQAPQIQFQQPGAYQQPPRY